MRRLVAWWVALAVVLSGATQLRLGGFPLGPGEALLACWVLFMAMLLLGGRVHVGPITRLLCFYWLAAAALLGFGAVMAVAMDRADTAGDSRAHDVLAYALLAAFTLSLSLQWRDKNEEYYLSVMRATFFVFTVCLTILLGLAMVVPAIGSVRFWYGGYRFAAWAQNPNQISLFALMMPFFGWYLAQRARGWGRVAYGLGIVCCIAIGLATHSDGLRVSWLASVGLTCLIAWYCRPVLRRGSFLPYVGYVIVPALVVASTVTYGPDIVAGLHKAAIDLYAEGKQGEIRFTVWGNGLRALSESPVVGWGPGAFSGLIKPFEGYEAHNTLIDWGASTGSLGIALHASLWILCAWRALSVRAFALFGAVVTVAIASMFGYFLRHPVYWLAFTMVLLLAQRFGRAVPAAQAQGSVDLVRVPGLQVRGRS